MLVGRDKEAKRLADAMSSPKSEFVAIFGRRRVGKTHLVRETFKDKFSFYHTGLANAPMSRQLSEFGKSLNRYGRGEPGKPKDWFEAFDALRDLLDRHGKGKKIVFLDELPWMDTARSSFVSALEHFWNGWASARADILLIVCGSATSWIINKVLNDHGGLHNRVTRRIHLHPFSLGECERFARANGIVLKRRQLLEYYMIFGGIPYYWEQLERGESLAQCIDRILFSEDGELRLEFDRLYASLFRKPDAYVAIVTALATKKVGMSRNELAIATKQKLNGKFSERLLELEQCGFIRKYLLPGRTARDALYQLIDNFTLFHFKFLDNRTTSSGDWTHLSASQTGRIWCGLAFERVCLQHIGQIKAALGIADVQTSVYGWRHTGGEDKGAQIDLVIERRDNVVNLCEMKYTAGKFVISAEYEQALLDKIDAFQRDTSTDATILLTFITSCGLTQNSHSGCIQKELTADALFA